MENQDELVQVNVSLPKSHFTILPELMRVVTTACTSTYSWDSMKLSVDSIVPSDKGSRIVLNLGKTANSEAEIIQGKMHMCHESVCKHQKACDRLVGDVKLTTFFQRSLKEYFKEQEKSDEEELEGTGWLPKEVSNEMFFPSWYDHLRLKSVSQLGDGLFLQDRILEKPTTTIETNLIRIEPFYESASDEYFPIKNNLNSFQKSVEEDSDETFRLKKVCDRAKHFSPPQDEPEKVRGEAQFSPPNVKMTIRELKERLDPPLPSQRDIYEENYVFLKSALQNDSDEKDYTYRQYLCYEDDIPTFPLCETDESLKTQSDMKNRELQLNFMRQKPVEDFKAPSNVPDNDSDRDDLIVVMPPSIKKTLFHRSYSANVVSQQYNNETVNHREFSPSRKKREEKKRPKSGPEKRVEFVRPPERDELSQGDSLKIIDAHKQDSIRNLYLNVAARSDSKPVDEIKEKKKKRRAQQSPERKVEEVKTDSHSYKDHDKKPKEKKHKTEEKNKDNGPTLVISYKPYEDDTRSDLIKIKPKYREEKPNKIDPKHKKGKKLEGDDSERKSKVVSPTEKQDDKKERRSRGKEDESKTNKKPRSDKSEKTRTLETKPPLKSSKPSTQPHLTKDKTLDTPGKGKKRGFLGMKGPPGTAGKDETPPSTYGNISTDLEEKTQHNKRAMSFLEIISAVTEEVKQFGKRKEQKRYREKVS